MSTFFQRYRRHQIRKALAQPPVLFVVDDVVGSLEDRLS